MKWERKKSNQLFVRLIWFDRARREGQPGTPFYAYWSKKILTILKTKCWLSFLFSSMFWPLAHGRFSVYKWLLSRYFWIFVSARNKNDWIAWNLLFKERWNGNWSLRRSISFVNPIRHDQYLLFLTISYFRELLFAFVQLLTFCGMEELALLSFLTG